jgi:hypothetical protein
LRFVLVVVDHFHAAALCPKPKPLCKKSLNQNLSKKRRTTVAASLLTREQPIIDSGYAWLVSEANLYCDSNQACGDADLLDKFDELVAADIVESLQEQGFIWSLRATGDVVLDVLDRTGMLDESSHPIPARELVLRAHDIVRQIVPSHAWNAC